MISPVVKKTIEQTTSTVISFVIIMFVVAIFAMFLARLLGAKSQVLRQIIFSLVVICGGYFAFLFVLPMFTVG